MNCDIFGVYIIPPEETNHLLDTYKWIYLQYLFINQKTKKNQGWKVNDKSLRKFHPNPTKTVHRQHNNHPMGN